MSVLSNHAFLYNVLDATTIIIGRPTKIFLGGIRVTNGDLKELFKSKRLYQYEVAEAIGISEYTLCVWLRHELEPERKQRIIEAVDSLMNKRANNGSNFE